MVQLPTDHPIVNGDKLVPQFEVFSIRAKYTASGTRVYPPFYLQNYLQGSLDMYKQKKGSSDFCKLMSA